MEYLAFKYDEQKDAIISLYSRTFGAAEGEDEGKVIGKLVSDLIETTAKDSLYCFAAVNDGKLAACILLSRMPIKSATDETNCFLLSPVAVDPAFQRQGVGQALINTGLKALKEKGVEVVITYGDPKYYSQTGFQPISSEAIQPPFKLSQPIGWIGQSLTVEGLEGIQGVCHCVEAFNNVDYW